MDLWNEKNPNIHVTVNKQDGGDPAITKLLTAVKAGSGAPDLIQAEYQKIPTLVAADALADLSGDRRERHQGPLPRRRLEFRHPRRRRRSTPCRRTPAPWCSTTALTSSNSLGLAVPTTWDEYAEAAKTVHDADPEAYLGTFSSNDAGWFTGMAQQAGASWWGIDGDAWSVKIDEDPTREGRRLLGRPGRGGHHRQQADVHPRVERRTEQRQAGGLAQRRLGPGRALRQCRRHRRQVEGRPHAAVGCRQAPPPATGAAPPPP